MVCVKIISARTVYMYSKEYGGKLKNEISYEVKLRLLHHSQGVFIHS